MQNKTAPIPEGSFDRTPEGSFGSLVPAARPWRKGLLATAATLAMLGVTLDAQALALGAVTVRSALGEPLRAEIEVPQISSEEAASFQVNMGSRQAFQAAGVDYSPALAGTRVTLHRRANGQAYLRVVGDRPVNEPFLGLVIEANWNGGRIVRDYTMLVDPPGRAAPPPVTLTQPQADAAPAPVAPTPPATVAEQTTPAVQSRRAPEASRATPRRAAAPAGDGGGNQVTVQRGDTAYGLASTYAADGVSLDQMLVAMLRHNPRAFINGNVNLMRAGAVIQMPTAEQAAAVPRQTARRTVVAQTRDFQAYRRGVATRAQPTRVAAADRTATGGIQPQVQETRPAAPVEDRLTISRSSEPTGAESQVAQSRQAQEEAERVAELNRNLEELNKLQGASSPGAAAGTTTPGINVPVGGPAAAAQTAASAAAESAQNAASAAQAAVAEAASAAVAASAAEPAADAAAQAASEAEDAASAAVAATPAEAPAAPPPPPPRVTPPPPPPEPSFLAGLMENPMLPIAGAGLLALLAGYGFYRSRQRKKAAAPLDSSFIESRLQPDSFFGSSGGQRVNTKDGGGAVGSSSMAYSPSQLDAAGDVDPVAEADVYLAYGRDMQAEEILKEALRTQPGRVSIHRKLAEIYAKRRDARALEAIATEAYGITQGTGPDWLAITSLGSELEPGNQLYQPGGVPVVRTSPVPVRPSFGADTEPQTAQVLDKDGPVSSGNISLDLDLDLDDAPVRAAPSVAPSVAAGAAAGMAAAARAAAPVPPPPAPAVVAAPAADAALDFGLDFTPPSELNVPAPATPRAAPAPTVSADAGMIDFDMDALSLDPDSRSGGDLKTEQPDDIDEDPLGTKLALAQEFHAIGDTEGARTMVKEVIAESTGATRARAERFLAELS
ncbi:MAG: FimV/HubP family polar landmark protein [Pseudomonadota bacterium]|nr:FimV/HubP family polar landmark protein [Pseudomonadota bacterium]